MSPKPRNRAGIDADAVARMMREQEEVVEVAAPEADLPVLAENAPVPKHMPEAAATKVESREAPAFDPGKVDGRTLRRTGREPFATRIKPETHAALKRIAYGRGITIAEALEISVAAFERG